MDQSDLYIFLLIFIDLLLVSIDPYQSVLIGHLICIDQLIHIDPIGAIDPIDLPSPVDRERLVIRINIIYRFGGRIKNDDKTTSVLCTLICMCGSLTLKRNF